MTNEITTEARRYLSRIVLNWDEMPDYVQDLAVGKLVNHVLAHVEDEERRLVNGDSTFEPTGLLEEWRPR